MSTFPLVARLMPVAAVLIASRIFLATVSAAEEGDSLEPIDALEAIGQFTADLAKLVDEGQPVDLARVREQVQDQKSCVVSHLPPTEQACEPCELYDRCRKSVVLVGVIYKCSKCDKWHTSVATGFVIGKAGVVVTNHHVLAREVKDAAIAVGTWDGRVIPIQEVLAASEVDDLVVMQVDADDLVPLPLAPSAPVGTEVLVIGHPVNRLYMMTSGMVSGHYLRRTTGEAIAQHQMTITADFAKGSSGSPVLDRRGAVVGIARSTTPIYYEKKDGVDTKIQMVLKYCIPSTALLKLLGPSSDEEP